ncbi:nitroreductase/quinone reductase family protein [Streptomyces sp. XH2]|uniref:nitroreductase/quinone reductase family protein n=1 Tax=Streptomyces sp. XH2 TaxID=3412483 RepID=UPI003C7E9C62
MTDAINSNPFNLRVIEEFRATGGRVADFGDIPLLLLTTVGVRSGLERTTPLVYLADGERLVVFAANGGAPAAPAWYRNLMAAGKAVVEVGTAAGTAAVTDRFAVRPVPAEESEHEELWRRQTAQDPGFAHYRERTTRAIPVIGLVRSS